MSRAPSKTKTWVVLVTLLGLSAVMAYLFTPAGEATWGEPETTEDAPERGDGDGTAPTAAIGPLVGEEVPEDTEGPALDSPALEDPALGDPAQAPTASFLGDAGARMARAPAVEAPPPPEPETPPLPREPAPLPVQIEEMTPEREHHRAVVFRDVLLRRLEDTRAAAAAARAEGNPNRAARLERQAERLAEQVPRTDAVEQDRAERLPPVGEPDTEQAAEGVQGPTDPPVEPR